MTFHFKIQLKNITHPPVWRRLLVPARFNFWEFHLVIQAAFGWKNYHMFQFSPSGYGSYPTISMKNEDFDDYYDDVTPADETKLGEIFNREKQTFTYIYDFGDNWVHKITLEKITGDEMIKADCIGGKGVCPPEDCGGPWGYANLLETIKDPTNPEYEQMREWLGMGENEEWDVNAVNLSNTSERVRLI